MMQQRLIKGISNAKWDTEKYSYNTGADWWLKKNQKKYGYTYTSKGVSGAGKGENGWQNIKEPKR